MDKNFRKLFSKSKEYILLIILLVISLILLPLNNNSAVKKIKTYAFATFAISGSLFEGITSVFSNNSETLLLKKQNAKLMLSTNKLREYALENRELKQLLEFKNSSNYNLIPSTVVLKNVSNIHGTFIINSGLQDSILKSMPVLNEMGLIGIVKDVEQNYSTINTISNVSLKISGTIVRSNVHGIVSWNGDELIMKNIPTTADVKIGDRVVTSVISTILPPSIPIGVVVKKSSNISGILNNVLIEPFVDVNSIKNVFILTEVKSEQIHNLELNLIK